MLTLNNHYSSTIRAFQGGLSRLQVLAKFLRITTALYKIGHCTSWLLTCCHYTTPLHQHLPLHLPGLCHDLLEVSAVHPKSTRSHLVRHSTPRPTRVSVSRATSAPSVTSKSKCSGFGGDHVVECHRAILPEMLRLEKHRSDHVWNKSDRNRQ